MKKSELFWQTYLNLEKEVLEISRYIFFTDIKNTIRNGEEKTELCNSQLEAFSPYIADLLVRCCIQTEAISKELYIEIGGEKKRDKDLFFDEDCLKEIDKKWETSKKVVLVVSSSFNFVKDENIVLKPLKEAHKRQGTYWEKAYQAVKHDRYLSLHRGNVKALIHALAALYLLNIYYRNVSWVTKYQNIPKDDYSLGSGIFSVKPPATGPLWYGNNPVVSDSPFIVQYQEESYKRIEEIQKNEDAALADYLSKQPEIDDPEFFEWLRAFHHSEEDDDSTPQEVSLWELEIYRLNKKIPPELPFEERKQLLIRSNEWSGWIHLHNKHLSAEEINEDNIQSEIDNVGRLWGIELTKKYQPMKWLPMALNDSICEIRIPNE